MDKEFRYYAFISYSHKDEEWASWLQHEFEHYHLPANLNGQENLPKEFRPIFRDIDELSGGKLKPQISKALDDSANLIVICSPNSAKSRYVNGEIEEFLAIGRKRGEDYTARIYPFIIGGTPHALKRADECFPAALRNLPAELIAGDAPRHGREQAFVKILSGTLRSANVSFSMLWDRFERDRIEEERRKREERDRLLLVQSRYLSEKAQMLNDKGDFYLAARLAVEALPKNMSEPDRPYCPEAEYALRCAFGKRGFALHDHSTPVGFANFSPDGKFVVTAEHGDVISEQSHVSVWNVENSSLVARYPYRAIIALYDSWRSRLIVREWSWDVKTDILDIATGKKLKSLTGCFYSAAFSPDGSLLAFSQRDEDTRINYIKIYDASTYRLLKRIRTDSSYFPRFDRLIFSKDNKSIAVMFNKREITEYSLETGKPVFDTWFDLSDSHKRSSVSPGEQLYNLKSESEEVGRMLRQESASWAVAVSHNQKLLAYANASSAIDVYEIKSGKLLYTLTGHTQKISGVCWSADDSLLISASADKSAIVWDLPVYRPFKAGIRHTDLISDMVIDTTGRYIKSGSHDDTTLFWDARTGAKICDSDKIEKMAKRFAKEKPLSWQQQTLFFGKRSIVDNDFNISSATLSGDGRYIAVGNVVGAIRIYDAHTLTFLKELNTRYHDEESKQMVIDELHDRDMPDYGVRSLEFSSDSSHLVAVSREYSCRVWDIATGENYAPHHDWTFSARFSPDGNSVLMSVKEDAPELVLWDYRTGTELRKVIEPGESFPYPSDLDNPHVAVAAYIPEGSAIVASVNNSLRFFHPETLDEIKHLNGHDTKVLDIAFTDDERYIVSQSDDTGICIWDTVTFAQVDTFYSTGYNHNKEQYEYSDDLFRYISPEKVLFMQESRRRPKPSEWVSPDGSIIVREDVSTDNGTNAVTHSAAIFNAVSGVRIGTYGKLPASICEVTVSRDNSVVACGCTDGTVKMWKIKPLQQLIDETRLRFAHRPFSKEERDKYYLGDE